MSDDGSVQRSPGWYPSPDEPALERWWDGRGWTAHTRGAQPGPSRTDASTSATAPTRVNGAARDARPRRGVPVLAVVAIGVGALIVGGAGGLGLGVAGATIAASGSAATPVAAAGQTQGDALDTPVPTEGPSTAFQYRADMFSITLKVTSKQCFGTAGCNVSVQPVLSADTTTIPDDATGSLTYEIRGDESGPITVTTDLNGTQYSQQQSDLSTSSSSKKITVRITDVETD